MSAHAAPRRLLSLLATLAVLFTALIAFPHGAHAAAGQEMRAGGSAGSAVTINSVSVTTTSGQPIDTLYYASPGKNVSYNLRYTFSTSDMSRVGGQELILYLPEGLTVTDDPTPHPFYINGTRQYGSYVLENNTIRITFTQPVNNLRNGDFNLQVRADNEYLARDADQMISIGRATLPVKKLADTAKHPVAKAGKTKNMRPSYNDLADNQVEWVLSFNPQKDTFTEPFTVNDKLQTLGGVIDQDRGGSEPLKWPTNPSELVVYDLATGADTGIRIQLSADRTGFSHTFTPAEVNGKTLYIRYRETIQDVRGFPSATISDASYAPNKVTIPATADVPNGEELIKTAATLSWGDAETDFYGTFQAHHHFYSSMSAFNTAKKNPDVGSQDGDMTKGAARTLINDHALRGSDLEEVVPGQTFRLVYMDSPDGTITVADPSHDSEVTNNYYENQKHKSVHYYVVDDGTPPQS